MIVLEYPDLLAVAARVLECEASVVVDQVDSDAVWLALDAMRMGAEFGDVAEAAGGLLHSLVQRPPFVLANRRIAVTATLHLLALNGYDLDLEPVGEVNDLLDGVAGRAVALVRLTDWLRVLLRPLSTAPATTSDVEESMFDRFTESARRAISLAEQEARSFDHCYIGTEHLLLGLIREGAASAPRCCRG